LAAEVGKLTTTEVEAYMKNTKLRSEALEWIKAESERAKALSDASKMLEHGITWDVITDVTGIKAADLKKAAKAAPARKLAKK
jgi:CRISPR/Cas system CMR subunit Cmr6 (Cas7 group RAMP superfamily)